MVLLWELWIWAPRLPYTAVWVSLCTTPGGAQVRARLRLRDIWYGDSHSAGMGLGEGGTLGGLSVVRKSQHNSSDEGRVLCVCVCS